MLYYLGFGNTVQCITLTLVTYYGNIEKNDLSKTVHCITLTLLIYYSNIVYM